jgi:Ca-activated chloride channel family protein
MSEVGLILEAFHFLRPLWLLLLLPIAALWWAVRRTMRRPAEAATGIAPHLRAALTVGRDGAHRLRPIDGVAATLALMALGAAGPTWSRQPDPFAAQSAPAVVALAVTPSMEDGDVPPSRLERGKQKIRDFLDLRAGARTALVAYAGSAHVVLPMTEDPVVMVPFLDGLSPEIMPTEGAVAAEALALAEALIAAEDAPGGILFVTDALDPADALALDAADTPVAVLAMRPDASRDRGLDALSIPVVQVTPDAADLRRIDGLLNTAYRRAQLDDVDQPWEDRAHWLAWPAALLLLLWFRRGWTMRWAAMAGLAVAVSQPGPVRAEGIADWFLTPDQQGRLAYDRRDFDVAAERFVNPLWRGYALYRDGQYEAAVEVLDRVGTAQAAFIQGMAHIKSRSYRDGVRSFETALARDPEYPGAAENLAQAMTIVEFVEAAREAGDTGEEAGIGADEIVFDNEANRGAETQMEAEEDSASGLLTADQWMRTVDTRTADFLRLRFALEEAQGRARPAATPAADAAGDPPAGGRRPGSAPEDPE